MPFAGSPALVDRILSFSAAYSDDEDDPNAPPLASTIALWRVQRLARERGVDPMTIIEEMFPDELARLGRPVAPKCTLPKTKRRAPRRTAKDKQ